MKLITKKEWDSYRASCSKFREKYIELINRIQNKYSEDSVDGDLLDIMENPNFNEFDKLEKELALLDKGY